jgi:hypothetical protein
MKLRFGLGRKDGGGGERDGFVGFERDEERKKRFWSGGCHGVGEEERERKGKF